MKDIFNTFDTSKAKDTNKRNNTNNNNTSHQTYPLNKDILQSLFYNTSLPLM